MTNKPTFCTCGPRAIVYRRTTRDPETGQVYELACAKCSGVVLGKRNRQERDRRLKRKEAWKR